MLLFVFQRTHLESSIHRLSKPDVFAVFALAGPPVLARDFGRFGVDAGLSCLHVAEDLDCIYSAALIRIDPVLAYKQRENKTKQNQTHDIIPSNDFLLSCLKRG